MQQRIEHRFACPADTFWKMFLFDEAYERALYTHLRLRVEHKVLESSGDPQGSRVRRELHVLPDRNIPAVLDKLLRGTTLVKERGQYDGPARLMTIDIELPVIGRVTDFRGRYTWQDDGPTGMRRVWEGECRVRVPLVGRQIETYLLDEVAKSLEQEYRFTTDWIGKHMTQPGAAAT